jgi:hypothetical protein
MPYGNNIYEAEWTPQEGKTTHPALKSAPDQACKKQKIILFFFWPKRVFFLSCEVQNAKLT